MLLNLAATNLSVDAGNSALQAKSNNGRFGGRYSLYATLLASALIFSIKPATVMAFDTLPDLGELYDTSIEFDDIRGAFARGNYKLALKLTYDLGYQEARQYLLDIKNIPVLVDKANDLVDKILHRSNKTNEENGEDVGRIIAASIEPYEFTNPGNDILDLNVKHSIEYGVSYLRWNNMIRSEKCNGYYTRMDCDFEGRCVPVLEYTRLYHVQIPDYYIYRIVGGKQELITKLKGHSQVSEHSYSLDANTGWSDLLKMAYNYWQGFETELPENQAMWMDLHADIRNPGESLAYKIVVDNSDYKLNKCGHKDQWVSTLTVDADGDGKMDYIPDYEYAKFFGKYYGWLVPAIALN